MKTSAFHQIAGWAGIFSAILYIASIIGLQFYLAGDLDDMNGFTRNMIESKGMMLLYGWPGIVATLLIFPLLFVFRHANRKTPDLSGVILTITLIGLAFVTVGYLFHLALTYFHAPIFQEMDAGHQASFAYLIRSTIGVQDMFWLGGDLLAFGGIGVLLLLGLREGIFPAWLLILGALSGFAAATGSFGFIPEFKKVPGLAFTFISGFSLFAIWEILAGVFLIRGIHKSINTDPSGYERKSSLEKSVLPQ